MCIHEGKREIHTQIRKPNANRPLGRPRTIISRY
jgi:hypothetical protein